MSVIPSLTWVKRGAAQRQPLRVQLSAGEMSRLLTAKGKAQTGLHDSDSESSDSHEENELPLQKSSKTKRKMKKGTDKEDDADEITKKYDLDDYDDGPSGDEDEDEETDDDDDSEEEDGDLASLGISQLAYYQSAKDDPYLVKDSSDSDEEDGQITEDDNLLVVGKVQGDFCSMEVHCYTEKDYNMYCHHDTILPSFPMCLEWIGYDPGEAAAGNLVAMGNMSSDIEIWDLDIQDTLEPAFVLEGSPMGDSKKKKKKKKLSSTSGHTDVVLDLSWNSLQPKALASASADHTVGVWDLEEGKMLLSLQHHCEKVQTLAWHPCELQTLLSGSFDKTVKVYDCRSSDASSKSWTLDGEVERTLWNHHSPYFFFASTDTGRVYGMDVRQEQPLFNLEAHGGAVTGLALSSQLPGCLLTSSTDRSVKVWDVRGDSPELVFHKNPKVGDLHCLSACPDAPLVFAVGGDAGVYVLNFKREPAVTEHFGVKGDVSSKAKRAKSEDKPNELALKPKSSKKLGMKLTKGKQQNLKKKTKSKTQY